MPGSPDTVLVFRTSVPPWNTSSIWRRVRDSNSRHLAVLLVSSEVVYSAHPTLQNLVRPTGVEPVSTQVWSFAALPILRTARMVRVGRFELPIYWF